MEFFSLNEKSALPSVPMGITRIVWTYLSLMAINEKAVDVASFSRFIPYAVKLSLNTFKLH